MPSFRIGTEPTASTSKLKLPKAAILPHTTKKATETATLTTVGRVAYATKESATVFANTPRLIAHAGMIAIVGLVVFGGGTSHSSRLSQLVSPAGYGSVLDEAAAADVANTVAQKTELVIAGDTAETAKTLNAHVSLVTSDDDTLAKPQVVDTAGAVSHDVQSYTVQPGDTLSTIASKFNITTDTVMWANGLSDEASLKPGQSLAILPISGVRHTVAAGETAESLAGKFQADAQQIIAFNNAEVTGLQAGASIIIPDGVIAAPPKPAVSATAAAAPAAASAGRIMPRGAGSFSNGYAFGYCTYYVASRRSVPSNWGNANAWYYNAQASGYAVGSTPAPGAIAWTGAGYYGHVAYVESVSGGMVTVSEMNYNGNWDRVTSRTVPASSFRYIY